MKIPKHSHYSLYGEQGDYFINHYFADGYGVTRRETVYSGIPDEQTAAALLDQLEDAAQYLHNFQQRA